MSIRDLIDLVKAKRAPKKLKEIEPTREEKNAPPGDAYQIDPMDFMVQQGENYVGNEHQGTIGLTFDVLMGMASRMPTAAIIQTRCNQVAEFARVQKDQFSLGFKVCLADRSEPTEEELAEIREIEKFLETCGPPDKTEDDLEATLRKLARDSLTYDQACYEVIRARNGKPVALEAVDASTIRRAKISDKERDSGRLDMNGIAFVQVVDNHVVAKWERKNMGFMIRRPRSWLKSRRYGYPELEELLQMVTFFLNAITNNGNKYIHGMHSAGILAFKSKMNPKLFRAFTREFESLLSGARNAHKNVLIQLDPENKEEIQQVNMSQSNADTQYDEWVAFLIKVICSLFQMDPAELGFVFGTEGQTHSLNGQSPEMRVKYSREKGLRPLLRTFERSINQIIFNTYDPWKKYRFDFEGFDAENPQTKLDGDVKKLNNFMTVNEMRAQYGLEPLEDPAADKGPLNSNFVQLSSAAAYEQAGDEEAVGEGAEQIEGEPPAGAEGEEEEFDFAEFFRSIGMRPDMAKAFAVIGETMKAREAKAKADGRKTLDLEV
jgi:hypothetical protein